MNQPYSHWPPFTINTLAGASLAVFTSTQLSTLLYFLAHLLYNRNDMRPVLVCDSSHMSQRFSGGSSFHHDAAKTGGCY